MSKKQIAVYAEALIDLSPEMLEYGCEQATRTAERFPWPGHIRKAAEQYHSPVDRSEYLGPRLDWSDAERLDYLQRWMRDMKKPPQLPGPASAKENKRYVPPPQTLSLDQQKEILRKKGLLK